MKQFTIIEEKWARGGKNGVSSLENEDGNRCCLGFLCLELGAKYIRGLDMPWQVVDNEPEMEASLKMLMDSKGHSSNLAFNIAQTNDSPSMTDAERKEALGKYFSEMGLEPVYQ